MKKKLFILLTMLIFSYNIVFSIPKAEASTAAAAFEAPLSDPLVTAVGNYLITGAMIASGAAAVGSAYGSQIKSQAAYYWNQASTVTKSAVVSGLQSAISAGRSTVNITKDMANGITAAMSGFGSWAANLVKNTEVDNSLPNKYNATMGFTGGSTSFLNGTTSYIALDYTIAGITGQKLVIACYSTYWYVENSDTSQSTPNMPYVTKAPTSTDYQSFNSFSAWLMANGQAISYTKHSGSTVPAASSFDTALNNTLSSLGDGTHAVDTAIGSYTPVSTDGTSLTYNPGSSTWTKNTDGTTYTGTVTWNTPTVGTTAGVTTSAPTTTAGTIEGTLTDGTTIPYEVPAVDAGAGTTTGTVTDVNVDTSGDAANKSKLDLSPLVLALGALTNVFPFSIPWDVSRLFSVFNVTPETPKFPINVDTNINILGVSIPVKYDFTLDFTGFDGAAAIGRWGLILVFDISMIMALRRLTPD